MKSLQNSLPTITEFAFCYQRNRMPRVILSIYIGTPCPPPHAQTSLGYEEQMDGFAASTSPAPPFLVASAKPLVVAPLHHSNSIKYHLSTTTNNIYSTPFTHIDIEMACNGSLRQKILPRSCQKKTKVRNLERQTLGRIP